MSQKLRSTAKLVVITMDALRQERSRGINREENKLHEALHERLDINIWTPRIELRVRRESQQHRVYNPHNQEGRADDSEDSELAIGLENATESRNEEERERAIEDSGGEEEDGGCFALFGRSG